MDQTPQVAAEISQWLTLIVLLPVIGLMWRSMLRLEDRLGKRIDGTNKRIDDMKATLGKRLDDMNAALGRRIDDTNKRIDDMNDTLDKRIEGMGNSLGARIDGIDGRLRAIENGQAEIKGKLDFVETYLLGRNDTRTVPAE